MQVRLKQNFVRVDISNPGNHPLVQEHWLEGSASPADQRCESGKIQVVLQRIRPEAPFLDKRIDVMSNGDLSELALIIKGKMGTVREVDQQPYVGWLGVGTRVTFEETGHAEVKNEPAAAIESGEQKLAMPSRPHKPSMLEV